MNPAIFVVLLSVLTPAGYACAGTAPILYAAQAAAPAADTLRTVIADGSEHLSILPGSRTKRQPVTQAAGKDDFGPVGAIIHR
ncbi:hypothetical protein [Azospirillum sp. Sh1]|uniref:hypothetical protein n=1 Tax=Azospirillum sp. Sh1 TaxID=2607285 RepID=UPI0011EE64BD|nr:hypothetical protein [Azospirillum sp. Sh1]KAA0573442.1 hypothetical protein FZ029_20915 [Azospirillum sp. Sh1]